MPVLGGKLFPLIRVFQGGGKIICEIGCDRMQRALEFTQTGFRERVLRDCGTQYGFGNKGVAGDDRKWSGTQILALIQQNRKLLKANVIGRIIPS